MTEEYSPVVPGLAGVQLTHSVYLS